MDGPELRNAVVHHLSKPTVQSQLTSMASRDGQIPLTMAQLVVESMKGWPDIRSIGVEPSVAAWSSAIVHPSAWVDIAFTQLVADLFAVAIHVITVDDRSDIRSMGCVRPCYPARSTALLEMGCWLGRHFVSIVDVLPQAAAEPVGLVGAAPSPPTLVLTQVNQVEQLLSSPAAPTILVAFEFSGAVTDCLRQRGKIVLSCDHRNSEAKERGPHFLGDVRLIRHLKHWEAVYFFPPCFQQLRADVNCLPLKMADGRAFWGCALVLWCLCCPNADMVLVEQPDTVVYDFFSDPHRQGVDILEFRTTQYGDAEDKFVRLAVRNAKLPPTPLRDRRRAAQPHRSQFMYADADERDRARSSWAHFPNTALAVAHAESRAQWSPLDYLTVILAFALKWHEAGWTVPQNFDNPAALPPDPAYQSRRGPGDGRRPPPDPRFCEQGFSSSSSSDDGDDSSSGDDGVTLAGHPHHPVASTEQCRSGDHDVTETDEHAPIRGVHQLMAHTVPLSAVIPATQCLSVVLFVSVLTQPLILAYLDGFTITGFFMPASARAVAMKKLQALCASLLSIAQVIFLVGQYSERLRVFVSPIDCVVDARRVVKTVGERERQSRRGIKLAWCSLAALQGSLLWDPAARALLSVQSFVGPTSVPSSTSEAGVTFAQGKSQPTSILSRALGDEVSWSWAAWRDMLQADERLKASILDEVSAGDSLLAGWAERITPFDASLIPTGSSSVLPRFDDPRLDEVSLSPVAAPLSTSWIPLPPEQPLPGADAPACVGGVRELMSPSAAELLDQWLEMTRRDLAHINASLSQGVAPAQIERERPPPLAIGQAELMPWARGLVWDCTKRATVCCIPSSFRRIPPSHLHLDWLRARLAFYPDQGLVSHLLEGVRLEADVELHSVLVPHLVSLPLGFSSVDREVRRMHALGWYAFAGDLPFWPLYLNGQGAAARKLEADRFRRTLEGGGPRQPVFDSTGLRAVPLNEASRVYHMPAHFESDRRPEFRQWLAQRGLPAPAREPVAAPGAATAYKFSKWPKERKPQLGSIMRDIAVLRRAAEVMREPVYSFGDDAKDYFNQLTMASSELHKLGLTFLAKGGEAPGVRAGQLFFVTELRLPFGLHCASNVAQRFSDALLDLFREEMDRAEWRLNRLARGLKLDWLRTRLRLHRRTGEPCVRIARFTEPKNESMLQLTAPTEPSDIPEGFVCPQLRLFSAYMFTDDPQFVVVSPELAMTALRIEQQLVRDVGLIMAIPEKRSLGSWSKWIGVFLVVALGLVVVPRDKILRAEVAISAVRAGRADFGLYRSLCGLLEHLRAINLQPRSIMYGLYRPHRPEGESRFGPAGKIVCDPLMDKQLERWRSLLSSSCCVSVKRSLMRAELEKTPDLRLDIYSDACYSDVEVPGIGGYCHGLYWFVPVSPEDQPHVNIPVLELLGAVMNVLVFQAHLQGLACSGRGRVRLVLRTDALTTASALPAAALSSEPMVAVHLAAAETEEWQALAPYLEVEHIFGDANPLADAVSRQEWTKFHRLCTHMGVKPHRLPVPDSALHLLRTAVQARKRRLSATVGQSERLIPIDEARACFGGADAVDPPHDGSQHSSTPRALMALRRTPLFPAQRPVQHGIVAGVSEVLTHPVVAPAQTSPTMECGSPAGCKPSPLPRMLAALQQRAPTSSPLDTQAREAQHNPHLPQRAESTYSPRPPVPSHPLSLTWHTRLPELTRGTGATLGIIRAEQVRLQAEEAKSDPSSMGFHADSSHTAEMLSITTTVAAMGSSTATRSKDETAWKLWVTVCAAHGTASVRTAEDVAKHPQRTSHLLACLLLHAFSVCAPKSKAALFVKPDSALAYPLAIVRIYAGWGVALPGVKMLKHHVTCLKRIYVQRHGSMSLAPKRAEPMRFSMVSRMNAIVENTKVGQYSWTDSVREVFIFKRLSCFLMHTAFRLGEIVRHISGEIRYLTFSCVTWRINQVCYTSPPRDKLLAMVPGRDNVFVSPCLSKPDQTGEVFCPFPVSLTFSNTDINAVAALRDLELDTGCQLTPQQREVTPLFCDANRQPFTYHKLTAVLKAALAHCYGEKSASLYTFHSYRSGLATALHAAGVDDPIIQLVCRWMCPASLQIYRRIGTAEHETLIRRASCANVDTIQSKNVPRVDSDVGYAAIVDEALAWPRTPSRPQPAAPSPCQPAAPLPRQRQAPPLRQVLPSGQQSSPRPRRQQPPARRSRTASAISKKQPRAHPQPPARAQPYRMPADLAASLAKRFPKSLKRYKTFFKRASTRHPPTLRVRQGEMQRRRE